jgi:hypothetical protein
MGMDWNKDMEKRILTKYRFTLTMRVLKVIAATLFFFWLYMLAITIIYDEMQFGEKHAFYSKLAMDWTQPNLYEEFGGFYSIEITPFLTQKITYPVYKMIGKETVRAGEVKQSKPLLPAFSQRTIQFAEPKTEKEYKFYLPEDPRTGNSLGANEIPGVWTRLEKVHEGTVAELSFSTKTFVKPEELYELLKPYDVDVLWMPLYAGEMKEFDTSWGGGGDSISLFYNFGFTGAREANKNFTSQSKIGFEQRYLEENKSLMLKQMNHLLENESKSYRENFLGLDHLEERYSYLMENGFTVYGAVVTGPVKELLKLKEVEQIHGANLGNMTYWNWSE